MKRKPLSKGEWALLLLPFLAFGTVFAWNSQSSLRDEWILRRTGTKPRWWRLTWSPDSRLVAILGGVRVNPPVQPGVPYRPLVSRGQVQLFDQNGKPQWFFAGYDASLGDLEFSPDSKRLMARTQKDVCVWDVTSSTPKRSFPVGEGSAVWSDDNRIIIAQSEKPGNIAPKLSFTSLDVESGVVSPYVSRSKPDLGLRSTHGFVAKQRPNFPASGMRSSVGGEIDISDAKGHKIVTLAGPTEAVMAWNSKDTLIALRTITSERKGLGLALQRVDAITGKQTTRLLTLPPFVDPVEGQSLMYEPLVPTMGILSPDTRLAAIWSSRTIWVIDTVSAAVLWKQSLDRFETLDLSRCAFSPDSRFLARLSSERLLIVNAATGEEASG